MKQLSTLNLSVKTKERLDKHGRYKESYDALVNRLLDIVEGKIALAAKKGEIVSTCR